MLRIMILLGVLSHNLHRNAGECCVPGRLAISRQSMVSEPANGDRLFSLIVERSNHPFFLRSDITNKLKNVYLEMG